LLSGICTEDDLAWVKSFYSRIINGSDPFTVIRKAKEKEEEARRARHYEQTSSQSPTPVTPPMKELSLWDRIVASIKKIFTKK
jgi:hypothetical protein